MIKKLKKELAEAKHQAVVSDEENQKTKIAIEKLKYTLDQQK